MILDDARADAAAGPRVTLRPISREDYPLLFRWRSDVSSLHLWSTQRRLVAFEQFVGAMDQILQECVFLLIVERATRRPLGFVHSYGASPEDGFVHFVLYCEPGSRGTGLAVEGAVLFGDYLFKFFAIRKLYAEVYDFNRSSMDALVNAGFTCEGVLREHLWYDDRYWDMHQLALYRRDWDILKERMNRLFVGRRSPLRTARSYLHNGAMPRS